MNTAGRSLRFTVTAFLQFQTQATCGGAQDDNSDWVAFGSTVHPPASGN
jgi:hypothetical protein